MRTYSAARWVFWAGDEGEKLCIWVGSDIGATNEGIDMIGCRTVNSYW
jgi:hypothetical protein